MRKFNRDKYRVIQWATGHQGQHIIRMIASPTRPHLELVGGWVHSPDKVGVDLGTLAGIAPLGVAATNDTAALLAMEADCIIYSPFHQDIDLICRMLEAGKDVVTQIVDIYITDDAMRAKLDAACRKGGSTLYTTGINPGFMSDRFLSLLSNLNGEIEHIQCIEYSHEFPSDLSDEMLFNGMGFGWTQAQLDEKLPMLFTSNRLLFFSCGEFVAKALGFTIAERRRDVRFAMLSEDLDTAGRHLKAGTVGAASPSFRMFDENGKERIELTQCWKIDPAVPIPWGYDERPSSFYQITVTGTPSYKVFMEFLGDPMTDAVIATAANVVNAIPFICDAPSGIQTQIDLPLITFSGELS